MTGLRIDIVDPARTDELRRAVLRSDAPADVPLPPWAPPGALHLAAVDADGRVVGTCAIFPEPYPTRPDEPGSWQLRGMATDPAVRGTGAGVQLLVRADAEVRARGGRLLWCNARVSALGFYERCGWVAEGEVFVTEQTRLPHRRMARELPPLPTSSH